MSQGEVSLTGTSLREQSSYGQRDRGRERIAGVATDIPKGRRPVGQSFTQHEAPWREATENRSAV